MKSAACCWHNILMSEGWVIHKRCELVSRIAICLTCFIERSRGKDEWRRVDSESVWWMSRLSGTRGGRWRGAQEVEEGGGGGEGYKLVNVKCSVCVVCLSVNRVDSCPTHIVIQWGMFLLSKLKSNCCQEVILLTKVACVPSGTSFSSLSL